jgi:hypothetical protein
MQRMWRSARYARRAPRPGQNPNQGIIRTGRIGRIAGSIAVVRPLLAHGQNAALGRALDLFERELQISLQGAASSANVRVPDKWSLRRLDRLADLIACYVSPTTFLYNHRLPSQRRHTCPQTSLPEIERLGTMTRQRCQTSAHAGFELSLTPLLCALISVLLSPPRKRPVTIRSS